MKSLILIFTFFSLAGCLQFEKDSAPVKSGQTSTQKADLYFGTQQEPLVTLDYVTFQMVGERVDLNTLAKLRIQGSNLGNSSEYGGDFIREKGVIKQLKDPKDNYFKVHWETTSGESFNINIDAVGGVVRL